MPTFLVFKSGTVSQTIRGANPSALRSAVAAASSDVGRGSASNGTHFQSKGHRLGDPGAAASRTGGSAFPAISLGGFTNTLVRFTGLYVTTLFSFDAYAAAEASPFNVKNGRR